MDLQGLKGTGTSKSNAGAGAKPLSVSSDALGGNDTASVVATSDALALGGRNVGTPTSSRLIARNFAENYTRLLAVGLACTLGFQVFIIVGGVIGLFPLTGITLPFMSYGGSSLVANFVLVALVWAMSGRSRALIR